MYKHIKVSPSALAATERCPRFRPDGEENQAAVDGTMFHEFMQEMIETVPRDQWDSWIATRTASPSLLGLLETAADAVKTIVIEDLPIVKGCRLRMRNGQPRKSPLKPGLYPECELERGQGRHGYIDLMVVTREGLIYIIDYKSNRVGKDFSWQLGAYAVDVNTLCPAHEGFICMIIAPRLDDEEQLRMEIGPQELAMLRTRIDNIEKRADEALWNDAIVSCPGDQCEHCHAKGRCHAQANATITAASPVGNLSVTTKTRTTIIPSFTSLTGHGGPYEGEVITAETFTHPTTVAQRGLRRACLKFIEVLVDQAKEDDKTWAKQYTEEQLRELVPGYTVSWRNGRGSFDESKASELREAAMSQFGLSIEDIFDISDISKSKLEKLLVDTYGHTKTKATDEVKKLYEPYTTPGAPVLFWTQRSTKSAALN